MSAGRPEALPVARAAADVARAMIARAMLDTPAASIALRDIELAPHQREAVARLRREIARAGGALLADAVGLGKTYVALALAAEARCPLVIAPAALRPMWLDALARTGVRACFLSTQGLSHGLPRIERPDLVIVDEAHHFRNPATRRYGSLAELTRCARVLLLSATPVHNTGRELDALLALFLGTSAAALDDAQRARCILRREAVEAWGGSVPRVEPARWLTLTHRDDLLDAIAALPAPVPPSDGDEAGALLTFSLLRQWASSEGALAAALRRRLARAAALIAALEDGRHPSTAELSAWRFADDAVQLAFPGLVAVDARHPTQSLLEQARQHEEAARRLLRRLTAGSGADAERARRLRALRAAHAGERIVVFSQFADTIDALWREMRGDSRVCALAGRGARVAGGAISRGEAMARFAPRAAGVRPPADAERIDLLLTTDLLSEGVNLQDASVIVHVDLPWTPARIEQRVGRLARPGAASSRIMVYAFTPPARAEAILAVERRLREKLRVASRASGVSGTILPGLFGAVAAGEQSPSQHQEQVRRVLESWRRNEVSAPAQDDSIVVAFVRARQEGFVALLTGANGPTIIGSLGGVVSDDPRLVARAVALASDDLVDSGVRATRDPDEHELRRWVARVTEWMATRQGAEGVELRLIAGGRARKAVLRRVGSILSRAPRHARSRIAPLAHEARRSAMLPLGSGAERVLRELADAPLADEAWLRAVAAFGSAHRREWGAEHDDASTNGLRLSVFIVLGP